MILSRYLTKYFIIKVNQFIFILLYYIFANYIASLHCDILYKVAFNMH